MVVTCATCAKVPQVKRVMNKLASKAHTPTVAMIMLVIFGFVTSFINWAFCTVVGALFAMYLAKNVRGMHFPLMLAVIYTCMVFGQCLGPTASVYALLATEDNFLIQAGYFDGILSQDITVYNPHNVIIWAIFAVILLIIAILTKPPQHEIVELKTELDDADVNYDVESRETPADKMNGGKLFSAAIVNLFIPSQGGQIIVQGPLLLDAANQLGANKIDVINAFVYGDECTNLLQPLYLIPMLAVVNMKLKDAWGMCAFICLFWFIVVTLGYLIVPGLVPMAGI